MAAASPYRLSPCLRAIGDEVLSQSTLRSLPILSPESCKALVYQCLVDSATTIAAHYIGWPSMFRSVPKKWSH